MHNAEYNHFCENNGLKRYDDRLSIAKWNRSEAMKAVRAAQRLEKKKKSAIIDAEKIREDILNNKYNLNLNIGNQNKHIKGSHSYNEEKHKSILFGDLNYAQGLVEKYHGTGDIKMTEDGVWTKKEFVEANFDVGLSYNRDKQQMQPTNRFAIHYGKRGTHIVPVERKE